MTRKYSAILFDLDGTVIDIGAHYSSTTEKFSKEHGLSLDQKYLVHERPYMQLHYEILRGKTDLAPELIEKLNIESNENIDKAPWCEGAEETIKELKKRGYKLGIITNGSRPRIEKTLEYRKMDNMFNVLICREDLEKKKPDPQPLLLALEKLNIPADKAIYVGNNQMDIECGKAAGTDTAFLVENKMYMEHIKDYLSQNSPTYTIYRVNELLNYFP